MAATETTDAFRMWATGLFEGEGTVTISSGGKRGYTALIVMLTMTDAEPPTWLHAEWGGGLRTYQPPGRAREATTWRTSGRYAARFLRELLPHFRTQRVIEKAKLGLAYHDTRQQGARDPDYRRQRWEFKNQMALLNRRGT